jgi:hypothetical protein
MGLKKCKTLVNYIMFKPFTVAQMASKYSIFSHKIQYLPYMIVRPFLVSLTHKV